MPIIACPECGKRLRLNMALPSGKRIQCPACSARFAPQDDVAERPGRNESHVRSMAERRESRPRHDAALDESRPRNEFDFDFEDRRPRRPRDDDREDRPRRRDRDGDDYDDRRARFREDDVADDDYDDRRPRRRRKKGSNKALILGLSLGGGGLLLAGTVALILVLTLGGSSHESAVREAISLMNEFASALESIKDVNSAKAAASRIEKLGDRLEALGKRMKDMPKPSKEEERRLKDRYEDQLKSALQRVMTASMQIPPQAAAEPALQRAMKRLQNMRPL